MDKKLLIYPLLFSAGLLQARQKPNVVIIFTDDQGYQDLGCYGSPLIQTPFIDRMAKEGIKLTDFYVSSSVSSASRAGLLTGRLNTRNGVKGVFFPESEGMPSEEITLAEALKEQGYTTGCFGKWHLGDLKGHLPTDQGFDYYYGIPYSNDMYIGPSQQFASNVTFREGYNLSKAKEDQEFVRTSSRADIKKRLNNASPLFEGDKIIEYPCDQSTTTRRYFDHAIDFIENNPEQPFFVYITPSMPHVPLFASEQFKGKSKRGLYGDVVEEIDWNVGRLIDYLDKKKLAENTLVIFASDNGPWLSFKEDGGSAEPLRGGKFSYYEGGVRVPCIIRWKGSIPAGVTSDAIVASIDLFPTIMHYAGCQSFKQKIDGINISSFLKNPSLRLRDEYVYVKGGEVHGIRKGDWVYLPKTGNSKFKKGDVPELFNLKQDIGESNNLHLQYPNKVKELQEVMKKYQSTSTMPYSQIRDTLNNDRQYWIQTLVKIADPVISNLSKDQLKKNIPVGRSSSALASSREFITHMEAVGRTIAGIAPWLELGPDNTPEGKLREKYIKMTCKALANSVNPESNDYFNSTATRQILVNSAFLIQGLLQAPTQLWGNLDDTTLVKIADPVISNLSKDQLKKNIPVGRSSSALASSREFITHMEAVGRTIAGIAPWLELGPDNTPEGKLREKYIKMTCKALANSVNPESNDYFNSTATRQILVNSAFLIQGLLQAPTQLWGNLDDTTRKRLIEQWKSTRTMKPGNNNWLLFSAMVECGLKEFSGEWNFPTVERALTSHREWYKGDGVYGDGTDFHLDYYNSYVIHPMLLQILKVTVKQRPSFQSFLNEEWIRFIRYAEIQERMIAPDGSYPVLGRSVSYRSAAFQVLGACALFGKLPESLKPGQVRGAMTAMLKRLFEQPGTFNKEGWLTIGVCGEQPELGDIYLSTPCVYLCSLGFLPLGLPANDPFWCNPVEPWTSIKAFGGIDFPIDKFIKP